MLHTYSEDRHHKKRVPLLSLPTGPLEPRGRGTADEVPHVVQKHAEHGREVQRGPPGARLRFNCRIKEMSEKGAVSHKFFIVIVNYRAPCKCAPGRENLVGKDRQKWLVRAGIQLVNLGPLLIWAL